MLTPQMIKDYFVIHPIASVMEESHKAMLRRIFLSLVSENDTESLLRVSELVAHCNQEFKDYAQPEAAIGRIARKALKILLA